MWPKLLSNRIYLGLVLIIVGVALGYYLSGLSVNSKVADSSSSCSSDLKFINPKLDCDLSKEKRMTLNELQDRLEVLISGYKNSGTAERISIFTRDLSTSKFISIGDSEVYYMASLLKLPVVIGGFKLAEVEPTILDQEIKYNGPNIDEAQNIKPPEEIEIGKSYTVRELMERAIKFSDNSAAQLLYDYYPKNFMDRILQALGLQLRVTDDHYEIPITARIYANLFRTLYNASYLTRLYSNETLSMLTESTYRDGAVAKLPLNLTVAHKFAERTIIDQTTKAIVLRQLHECGVVYAKDGAEPYSFCIMTEGDDFANLEKIQQEISLEIYNAMIKGE